MLILLHLHVPVGYAVPSTAVECSCMRLVDMFFMRRFKGHIYCSLCLPLRETKLHVMIKVKGFLVSLWLVIK